MSHLLGQRIQEGEREFGEGKQVLDSGDTELETPTEHLTNDDQEACVSVVQEKS